MKKLVVVGKILANEAINANVKRMVIEAPQIAEAAQPGQFVHVKNRTALISCAVRSASPMLTGKTAQLL